MQPVVRLLCPLGVHSWCDEGRQLSSLSGKHIVDVACGPTHSAALTAAGQLYVWGSSISGASSSSPLLISPGSSRLVQVACGSGDCTLVLLYSSGLRRLLSISFRSATRMSFHAHGRP